MRNIRAPFVALFLIFATPALSNETLHLGDGSLVVVNDGGMPTCWFTENTALSFEWDNRTDHYQRNLKAYPVGNTLDDCNSSPSLIERYRGVPIGGNSAKIFGKTVPSFLQSAFDQVSNGGTVYRTEATAKEYLKNHPISIWKLSTNRDLTDKFGVGFASMLYKEYLESNSVNSGFARDVDQYLKNSKRKERLVQRSANTTFVVVPGIGNDFSKTAEAGDVGMKEIKDDLISLGIRVKAIQTELYPSDLTENIRRIREELKNNLQSGSDVVLIVNSRGVAETLTAIARVRKELDLEKSPGRILGFINMSGLVFGSFIGDWAASNPYVLEALYASNNPILKKLFPVVSARLKASLALSMGKISKLNREFKNELPKETVYLNLVGTLGGNGLSKNGMVSTMQWISRSYVPNFGANDGYIEYPLTQIPVGMAPKNYTLAFEADHRLWTGTYREKKLTDVWYRRSVLASLLNTVLDRYGE